MSDWSDRITTTDGDYVGVDEADAAIAELEAENDALLSKGTPGWRRLREIERQRDEANTGAIAQRRSFEKALENKNGLIGSLERALCRAEARVEHLHEVLAALKARRCLECRYYVGCPIFTAAVDTWRERPTDFACSRWQERGK